MSIASGTVDLLNKFADSQPALNDQTQPAASSAVKLGDLLTQVDSEVKVARGEYKFAVSGGATGVYRTGISIPANSVITRVYTRAVTAFASAGSATVAVKVGAVTLKAATAFDDADYTAVIDQTDSANTSAITVPVLVTTAGEITLTVAAAALTDGNYKIWVEYLKG